MIIPLYDAVGGGPFPVMKMEPAGPMQWALGDIVIGHPEGIVTNNDNEVGEGEGYDMQQDFFADDMIVSGDEGLGYAQAQRLKRKLHRNRRRITESGYAVEGGARYSFGDMGGFSFKRMFRHPFGKQSLFQKAGRFAIKVAPYAAGGFLLAKGAPMLLRGAKGLVQGFTRRQGVSAVATTTPDGAPVPAPTGGTDATGNPLPADIYAAVTGQNAAASPIPDQAPTASEAVAAQTQDDQTQATVEEAGVAGGLSDLTGSKGLLLLGGLGLAMFLTSRGKRRSRRR